MASLIVGGARWFADLRTHELAIDQLQKQVGAAQSKIETLQSRVEKLESGADWVAMKRDVEWLVKGMDEVKGDVKEINGKLSRRGR